MIFTEKNKAFVKSFVPYYRLWTMESYERIPGKRRNTFGLDNLITELLKKQMSKRTHEVAYRGLCESLTSDAARRDRLFGLKLGCW